jgi:signal transduction histidine kinase
MKSEFVTTISHELRTPINALLGYSSLLQEGIFGEISDGQSAALDRMRASAEHLLKLINDILDLSTVEAGKLRLNVERIELAPFIRDVSETARSIVARKSLAFEVEIADGLPDVHTDVTRLRQVLLNLLGNAVKFTDVGHVLLRVVGDGDDHVLIEVEDTGIGIGEDDIDAIFEEFRQADQSVTRSFGGTGLGLAISRKLLTLMGGSVSIESQLGEGSTFRVRLPIAATAARAATT